LCNIAGTQPEADQEQNDRAITPLRRSFAVTGSDQSAYLFRRQMPRHVGKPPMGVAGNRTVETGSAPVFDGKIAQECAQAGRHLLDGSAPARARAIHEGATNGGRIPTRGVFPERRHQAAGITCVELDGGIGRAVVLAQPYFEAGDQCRLDGRRRNGGGLACADLDEVSVKELGAVDGVMIVTATLCARATTGAQMLAERL
jgi:hypothetical protein